MNADDARRIALALPGTLELPHHHMTSFRVGGKIFATLPPDGEAVHIFVDEHEARAAVDDRPGCVELLWWGKKLSGVRVTFPGDEGLDELVGELIEDAWRHKAPRAVIAAHDATR